MGETMQTTSTIGKFKKFKGSITVKAVMAALICLGLTLADIHPMNSGSTVVFSGPQPAWAQELVEPVVYYDLSIDRIGTNNRVVIGDHLFRLSDVIRFYKDDSKKEEISPSWFTVGTKVGFTINEFGEIGEIWLD
jgi:hypothetical protein